MPFRPRGDGDGDVPTFFALFNSISVRQCPGYRTPNASRGSERPRQLPSGQESDGACGHKAGCEHNIH